jgi:hypothetical protein
MQPSPNELKKKLESVKPKQNKKQKMISICVTTFKVVGKQASKVKLFLNGPICKVNHTRGQFNSNQEIVKR